jgi:hypothetical protein
MIKLKEAIQQAFDRLDSMSREEFGLALKEVVCNDIYWLLMYAENPELKFEDRMRLCFKHMWE